MTFPEDDSVQKKEKRQEAKEAETINENTPSETKKVVNEASSTEKTPHTGYAFECKSSRKYDEKAFNENEIVSLHGDVCQESSDKWNPARNQAETQAVLKTIIEQANSRSHESEKIAVLMVKSFALQPFGGCNRRTAACAGLNLLENSGLKLKEGVTYWDFKGQVDSLQTDKSFGTYDKSSHSVSFSTNDSEATGVKLISKWIADNTEKTSPTLINLTKLKEEKV